ncbi:hypothetical protein OPV22_006630 [Ensete ventricosum]|uniref:Uncharacterized protein n=1 Tax=Ensete ventricosum TaxID=4639 RepID=A0AAV8RSX9_ENSVE|nr:hypothetical protein OPV22_006630 [Ensete ventricosum]
MVRSRQNTVCPERLPRGGLGNLLSLGPELVKVVLSRTLGLIVDGFHPPICSTFGGNYSEISDYGCNPIVAIMSTICHDHEKIILNKVLLVGTRTKAYIGQPAATNAAVHAAGLDCKVIISKYKKKKNYCRTIGHRQFNPHLCETRSA